MQIYRYIKFTYTYRHSGIQELQFGKTVRKASPFGIMRATRGLPQTPSSQDQRQGIQGEATEWLLPDTCVVRRWPANDQKYRFFLNSTMPIDIVYIIEEIKFGNTVRKASTFSIMRFTLWLLQTPSVRTKDRGSVGMPLSHFLKSAV